MENKGSYDAVVYIDRRCELGRALLLLMYSAEDRPQMENIYYICAETKFWETIDPGEYEAYELCFEADLVSQPPTFKPRDIGNYEVIVTDALACFFVRRCSTFRDCVFK